MERNGYVWVLTACWLLMGCASTVKLSSVVTARDSGEPIAGAIARLVDQSDAVLDSALTDETGRFLFALTNLNKEEEYRVVVTKPLLSDPYQESVRLDRKPPIKAQIILPLLAGIKGVIESESGELIMGGVVEVVLEEDVFDQTETGPDGSFAIGTLDPGEYKLRIKHFNHYPTQTDYFDLERGQILQLSEERALKIKRIQDDVSATFSERLDSNNWDVIEITPQETGRLR